MLGGDPHELLAVRVTAVYFVKTIRRVAPPGDNGSACENIMHEGPGWVLSSKQARDSVFKRMVISPLFIEA